MPLSKQIRGGLFVLAILAVLAVVGLALGDTRWAEVCVILALGALMLLWTHQWQHAPRRRPALARGRILLGDCEIVPRQDASPEQLKRLGNAIARWWEDERADAGRANPWIDTSALGDLLAGELPQPFALRLLTEINHPSAFPGQGGPADAPSRMTVRELKEALQKAKETYPQLGQLLPQADARTVYCGLGSHSRSRRERIIDRLRRAIPSELVEDVRVDGQSWEVAD
jgi:hypothetical protein